MSLKDKALELHRNNGGKIAIISKVKITNKDDLALAYTPGVAEPCKEIAKDSSMVYEYTAKKNTVAVITDGTAVLGLGNIGPLAAIPVMEGKAILFKEFANIDSIPLSLDTTDTEELIKTIKYLAPSFGGINLEDISAPRCVEIERRLIKELDIPVFHDDQHGTAIIVSAALLNCCRLTKQNLKDLKVVISGMGAAGSSIARMLKKLGVGCIYGFDKSGVIDHKKYDSYNFLIKELLDQNIISNKESHDNTLACLMEGANMFVGVSAPNLVTPKMIKRMAKNPFIFAMANPVPEIMPEDALAAGAYVVGTGRSDFPNQINNVLAFPGIFRGALDIKAKKINEEMKIAAAYAIANIVSDSELSRDYIIPSVFDKRVVNAVSKSVKEMAIKTKVV